MLVPRSKQVPVPNFSTNEASSLESSTLTNATATFPATFNTNQAYKTRIQELLHPWTSLSKHGVTSLHRNLTRRSRRGVWLVGARFGGDGGKGGGTEDQPEVWYHPPLCLPPCLPHAALQPTTLPPWLPLSLILSLPLSPLVWRHWYASRHVIPAKLHLIRRQSVPRFLWLC